MTLIAYVFPKLENTKDLVRQMSKKPRFITLFDIQHGKGSQTLLKFALCTMEAIFSNFFIILGDFELENVSVSDISSLRTVC